MSMCVCQTCDAYIDSDFDADCFVEVNGKDLVMCEVCRDRLEVARDFLADCAAPTTT